MALPPLHTLSLRRITTRKERYLPLLLLADESADQIATYLPRGTLYGLFARHDPLSLAVLTDESAAFCGERAHLAPELAGKAVCECKNLVTHPEFRGQGLARQLLMRLCGILDMVYDVMILGTAQTPRMHRFYTKCGFAPAFVVEHFFRDNYPAPIVEDGIVLDHMQYYVRHIGRPGFPKEHYPLRIRP